MNMAVDSGSALSSAVVDALFRNCRFSLRIPNGALSAAGDYTLASGNEWTLNEVMSDMPARGFLYYGERVPAFVAAVIPNLEHLRWTLAASMHRTEAPELSQGELALSASECKQFFSMLDFCVTAFEATMAPPGSPSGSSASRPPKLLGVAGEASFTVNVSSKEAGSLGALRIGRLKGGAWCCVYPFSIDTPVPSSTAAGHSANSALSLEIRTACSGVDDSLQVSYADQPVGRNALSGRSAHLEELATRVSSAVFAHGKSTMGQSRLLASLESEHLDAASSGSNLAPEMPRRMFQALVLTRPIASASSLVTELPPSFGANAMLVAVSVRCEAIAARNLVLRSILIQSPEWHIQPLPAQPELPFALTSGSCWQSIYKLSPLSKSTKEDALRGLGLLNINAAAAAVVESSGRGLDAAVNDSVVHILVEATNSVKDEAAQAFRVAHRIIHTRQLPPTTAGGDALTMPAPHARRPSAAPSQVYPNTRSEHASSITHQQALRSPADQSFALLANKNPASGTSHSILDPPQPSARLSAITAQSVHSLPESNIMRSNRYKARAASMLKIPARSRRASSIFSPDRPLTSPIRVNHVPPAVYERGVLSEQRARAETIDALSVASRSRSRPSASVSTVRSELTSDGLAAIPEHVLANKSDSLPGDPNLGVSLGTIGLSFEAPNKVGLGDKIAVQVRVSNNTSIQYSRLCLVDGDSEPGSAEEEYGDMASHGLLSLNHATVIPPLRPGESTSIVLHYVAAAPHFHTARPVRLLDQEAGGSAGQTLATFESPFIVYVDDHDDNDSGVAGKRETPV
ncbi:hypothetical protein GGH93_003216 [Coemansia aciculifera]|nr:hypothetical protein GGH93_003216 [Coemansia aciculifera]